MYAGREVIEQKGYSLTKLLNFIALKMSSFRKKEKKNSPTFQLVPDPTQNIFLILTLLAPMKMRPAM